MWFDQMKDLEVKKGSKQPNLYLQLDMVGCTNKTIQVLSQGSWISLIGVTIYFYGVGPIKPQS